MVTIENHRIPNKLRIDEINTDEDLRVEYDPLKQLLAAHEKYKKDILGHLAGLVLCGYANTYPDYASFFGGIDID